ncbi:MAG: DUF1549 domain-containing protein [Akkermansiaceae bacterium]|nr:DUF1549 domain-containing protein [Akkermansiaceae bacterium]
MKTLITSIGLSCLFPAATLLAKPFSQETVRSTSNQIDQLLAAHLQEKQVKANPVIDDATFARRAYISISGRIPTAEEARSFITDPAKDKRRTLVDTLVQSNGYQSRMFNFWGDLLRLQTGLDKHGLGWHVWIRDAVEQNMPYDKFVNAMLSSSGMATENPAVGYYLRDRNMLLDNVSNTVQVFLGTQIGCAQCHDHPFDDWTQKQYYELAAFTGGTQYKSDSADHLLRRLVLYTMDKEGVPRMQPGKNARKGNQKRMGVAKKYYRDYASMFKDFRRISISDNSGKPLRLPQDYQYNDGKPGDILTPKTLFGESISTDVPPDERRKAFADWVTSPANPYFTKVIVNRLWAEVFGRGIVDPLDDWSETTRVSHPELLDYLCKVMKATDYDVRQFMRVLYHTRLFESAVATDEAEMGGQYDFRGPVLRRMSAEEIHDSFLVLEFGDRDDSTNNILKYRWDTYVKSVEGLFKMPIPQLVALNKESDAAEKERYAIMAEARKFKMAADKARNEGDTEKANKLNRQAGEVFKKAKKLQREAKNPMVMMMMERQLRTRSRPFMRASEQAAPSKPGSFMQQFGASDRMTPDASDYGASIPQALTLLNGREVVQLTDGRGVLANALRKADSPSERLDVLFLSVYGCMPTDAERRQYQPMISNATQLTTLARAMMNSKRFLFIQ